MLPAKRIAMEKKTENYIRFDWAMKRLLRNKANFDVLEGFLSSLFGKTVKIQGLLESEGNRERENDKANRVDLLALMDTKEKVIIEVQNNTETAYFQRMIFGTSKVLCDYINKGDNYEHVSKVYSVNIVYFALGKGTDYVYHGKTEFRGIHNGDILELNPFQKEKFEVDSQKPHRGMDLLFQDGDTARERLRPGIGQGARAAADRPNERGRSERLLPALGRHGPAA